MPTLTYFHVCFRANRGLRPPISADLSRDGAPCTSAGSNSRLQTHFITHKRTVGGRLR